MSFPDLAAMVAITGERFRANGMNPPRMVLTAGDFDRLLALIPREHAMVYDQGRDRIVISGVEIRKPRERQL